MRSSRAVRLRRQKNHRQLQGGAGNLRRLHSVSEQHKREFGSITSYADFQRYMYAAVRQIKGLPGYRFKMGVDYTDNSWWTPDNSMYEMLKRINELGYVTLNAQEASGESTLEDCKEYMQRDNTIYSSSRAVLHMMVPTHLVSRFDEIPGVMVLRRVPDDYEIDYKYYMLVEVRHKAGQQAKHHWCWYDEHLQTRGLWREEWVDEINQSYLHPQLETYIDNHVQEITIIDLKFSRLPAAEDGLFTKILAKCKEIGSIVGRTQRPMSTPNDN